MKHRVWEHREGLIEGFTRKYSVNVLVWFEWFADFPSAIARETQIEEMESHVETGTDREGEPAVAGFVAGPDRMKIKMDSRFRGNDDSFACGVEIAARGVDGRCRNCDSTVIGQTQ